MKKILFLIGLLLLSINTEAKYRLNSYQQIALGNSLTALTQSALTSIGQSKNNQSDIIEIISQATAEFPYGADIIVCPANTTAYGYYTIKNGDDFIIPLSVIQILNGLPFNWGNQIGMITGDFYLGLTTVVSTPLNVDVFKFLEVK